MHTGLTPVVISSLSSGTIRFGISPVFKRLLRFSIKDSSIIYVSVMVNDKPLPSIPDSFMYSFIFSLKELISKPLLISIILNSICRIKVHNLMRLCFPEPPTPINMI
jgi:hypothetical protein